MIVENSGLLTVAALKHLDVKNKKIVSILSGGNMDVITMSSIVQHGLIQRDRIFSVSVFFRINRVSWCGLRPRLQTLRGMSSSLSIISLSAPTVTRRWSCGLRWRHTVQSTKTRSSKRLRTMDTSRNLCGRASEYGSEGGEIRDGNEQRRYVRWQNECLHSILTDCGVIGRSP